MNRISTANTYALALTNLTRAQQAQNEAGEQVSSQKKASDLKGYSTQAELLVAMKGSQAKVQGLLDQTSLTANRLTMQDTALNGVLDSGQGAREAIANAISSGDGTGLMDTLRGYFATASSNLNTKFQGVYLFAGGNVDVAPASVTSMSGLAGVSPIGQAFTNDSYQVTSRLDENTTIQTGFQADKVGGDLFDAFKQVQDFVNSNGDFSGKLTDAQINFLTTQLGVFDTANAGLTDTVGENGIMQNRVDQAQTDLTSRSDTLSNMTANITNVDLAEAYTRLQSAQTAVEGAAQVFSSLNGSSLLKVLGANF